MDSNKIFIFGTSHYSEMLFYYLTNEMGKKVEGYTLNREFINNDLTLPTVAFEELIPYHDEITILIGIGYNSMNNLRKKIYQMVKSNNFKVDSFVHPTARVANNVVLGESTIVFENSVIQPFVKMGVCNIVWSNTTIAHNAEIGNFNFFSAGCTISGDTKITNNCFFGANCTVRDGIRIAPYGLIGAGAFINKDTEKEAVYSTEGSKINGISSLNYQKI